MHVQDLYEKRDAYLQMMESIPVQGYLAAAGGSMALSLLLRLAGKHNAASFFGQLPPTFMLMALVYKQLKPSSEDVRQDGEEAVRQAAKIITATH
jgi:hypothetical protein